VSTPHLPKNFAILGVGGFVAPRHLRAIAETGNRLVAACDPNDSVGVIDGYFPEARFFTEVERFDRFLEKQRRKSPAERVHYLSICTPNYLHDAHVRLALRAGAQAICEKPLVINPWNLDQLATIERETGSRVYTVLQLRLLEPLIELRKRIQERPGRHDVVLSYTTRRGPWYQISWKGDLHKSGGLPMNIGIHFFDLLIWIFGSPRVCEVHLREPERWAGYLELDKADIRWCVSVRNEDLPEETRANGRPAFRSMTVDGREIEFSDGFADLHTRVYRQILEGRGYGIDDARPSIDLAHQIRTVEVTGARARAHPLVVNREPAST
jgi:UDP-N-acetyl-2-amino-2-deoxyglucuronate dehydrogenase